MKLTVRLVHDHRTDRYWFEEKLDNGQWVKIRETDMACEGNARTCLLDVIEKRRQTALSVTRSYRNEEVFEILPDSRNERGEP